jgi:hypothetical protein
LSGLPTKDSLPRPTCVCLLSQEYVSFQLQASIFFSTGCSLQLHHAIFQTIPGNVDCNKPFAMA